MALAVVLRAAEAVDATAAMLLVAAESGDWAMARKAIIEHYEEGVKEQCRRFPRA